MTNTYFRNGHEYNMADSFCCAICKKEIKGKNNRQILRKNGGINYICMRCYNADTHIPKESKK